jgi:hypothetical protein
MIGERQVVGEAVVGGVDEAIESSENAAPEAA